MPAIALGSVLNLSAATRTLMAAQLLSLAWRRGNPPYTDGAAFPWGRPTLGALQSWMAGYAFTPPPFAPGDGDPAVCGLPNEDAIFPNGAAIPMLGSPFSVQSGKLVIQPTIATPSQRAAAAPTSYLAGRKWFSGAACTFPHCQVGGVFECEFQAPRMEPGRWPAFWLLPVNAQQTTELDVFEIVMSQDGVLSVTASVHSNNDAYMAAHWPQGGTTVIPVGFDPSAGPHRYAVWIRPDFTDIYIDRRCVLSYPTPPDFGDAAWYAIIDDTVAGAAGWDGPLNPADTALPPSLWSDIGAWTGAITAGIAPMPAVTARQHLAQAQAHLAAALRLMP